MFIFHFLILKKIAYFVFTSMNLKNFTWGTKAKEYVFFHETLPSFLIFISVVHSLTSFFAPSFFYVVKECKLLVVNIEEFLVLL